MLGFFHRQKTVKHFENVGFDEAGIPIGSLGKIYLQKAEVYETEQRIIVFNGKIHNAAIKQISYFIDTYLNQHSMAEFLNSIDGAFSLLVYDKENQQLIFANDRFTSQVFYYGLNEAGLIVGNDLKEVKKSLNVSALSVDALTAYFKFGYVPAPMSMYEGIYKIKSGEYLELDLETFELQTIDYLKLAERYQSEILQFPNEQTAITSLNQLLNQWVEKAIVSNQPKASFLSGGVDSGLVSAILQSQSQTPIDTYTIGFEEKKYNEATFASQIAKHLHTHHQEIIVTEIELLSVIPQLNSIYAEPFSDSSQIPTILAIQAVKKSTDTVFTGDGGDEFYGGYVRYQLVNSVFEKINRLPFGVRKLIAQSDKLPMGMVSTLFLPLALMKNNSVNYADKFLKLAPLLGLKEREDFYLNGFISSNPYVGRLVKNSKELKIDELLQVHSDWNFYDLMMFLDMQFYLPYSNVQKTSRPATFFGVDLRSPLLSANSLNFAMQLPLSYKLRGKEGKWILKQLLYQYVPEALYQNRPKMGFATPMETWLKGPLKDWAFQLLFVNNQLLSDYVEMSEVKRYWEENEKGKRNWVGPLWRLVLLSDWLNKNE